MATVSAFVRGLAAIVAGSIGGELRIGRFVTETWSGVERMPRVSEAAFDARQHTSP